MTGSYNTAIGYSALAQTVTGNNNTALGYNVGHATLQTGSNNILIGTSGAVDTVGTVERNYNLNIGNLLQGDMSDGTTLGTEALYLQSVASSVDYLQNRPGRDRFPRRGDGCRGRARTSNVSITLAPKGAGNISIAATTANAALDLSANTSSILLPGGGAAQRPACRRTA